jgi:hypothetical protein
MRTLPGFNDLLKAIAITMNVGTKFKESTYQIFDSFIVVPFIVVVAQLHSVYRGSSGAVCQSLVNATATFSNIQNSDDNEFL